MGWLLRWYEAWRYAKGLENDYQTVREEQVRHMVSINALWKTTERLEKRIAALEKHPQTPRG